MKLTRITGFGLQHISDFKLIRIIVASFYNQTNEKLSINFVGSKGYLSHIELSAEGKQLYQNNCIWNDQSSRTRKGQFRKKTVNIFYNEDIGVVLTYNNEMPDIPNKTFVLDECKNFIEKK